MSKIIDVVSWIMKDDTDTFLKLKKTNKTYDISDAVIKFLESKGLVDTLADKTVEVEIDETNADEDTGGLITRLALADGKKEEPKKEEVKSSGGAGGGGGSDGLVVKTIKIGGVSVPNESAVDEETKTWYNLDSTINAQEFKDNCTGKEVVITVLPLENGNDVIKSYNLIETVEDEPGTKEETTKKSYKNTGNSIEAQASLKCAKAIVANMVNQDSNGNIVCERLTKIATHAYELIQVLKNKE